MDTLVKAIIPRNGSHITKNKKYNFGLFSDITERYRNERNITLQIEQEFQQARNNLKHTIGSYENKKVDPLIWLQVKQLINDIENMLNYPFVTIYNRDDYKECTQILISTKNFIENPTSTYHGNNFVVCAKKLNENVKLDKYSKSNVNVQSKNADHQVLRGRIFMIVGAVFFVGGGVAGLSFTGPFALALLVALPPLFAAMIMMKRGSSLINGKEKRHRMAELIIRINRNNTRKQKLARPSTTQSINSHHRKFTA